jgi:tetratricopeptide (TPR) repeat protein
MPLQHLYLPLARAYELLSQMNSARGLYQSLLALARRAGHATLECVALNRLATLAAQSDLNLELSRALLREAQGVAEQHGDTAGLAETEWNLAQLGVYSWDTRSTLVHGQRALELARTLEHDELIARCLNVLALGYSDSGQCRRMEHYAREAAQIYARLGNRAMEADCLSLVANALVLAGQLTAGIEQGWHAIRIARASGSPWGQVSAAIHLATGLLDAGNYEEALELAREGTQLAREHEITALLPYILVVLGDVERALLRLDVATTIHLDALAADSATASRPFAEMVHSALCADYACVGDWASAHTHARQALAHRRYDALYLGLTRWHETEALLRGGDEEIARADAAHFGALVADDEYGADNPRFQIPYHRCLAVLATWEGDTTQAIVQLEAALILADEMQLPGEQWSILAALTALYVAAGKDSQAGERRRQAAKVGRWLADQLDDSALREAFSQAISRYLQG